jgi:hypothetical protein
LPARLSGPPTAFTEFNFLHFAFELFVLSLVVQIAAGLAAAAPSTERTAGLTVGGGASADAARNGGRGRDILLSELPPPS